jgi:predicted dienelactone hydrolase
MRPFELSLIILNLIALALLFLPLNPAARWPRVLPLLLLALTLLHLGLEGYRWQMVPAYLLSAALLLASLPAWFGQPLALSAPWPLFLGGLGWLVGLVSLALPIILPVPVLPSPPGPYAIGTRLFQWGDPARLETYSPAADDKRQLLVQVWYPAQPVTGLDPVGFIDNFDVALPAFADFLGIPAFTLDHLRLVRTNAFPDAPPDPSAAPYPVVVYSHGWQSYRTASTAQMEALASSGYIAVAIDHPYAAAFTIFPDGRVVLNDPALLPPSGREQPGDQAMREAVQGVMAADITFVLDQLARLNSGEFAAPLAGLLDLERLGLTGVSTGGGAALWVCHQDPRCKAVLAQDGWYEPLPAAIVAGAVPQPLLIMQSETVWDRDNNSRQAAIYHNAAAPAYQLQIAGILHYDFGDYPLLSPLSALLPERGSLNGRRTLAVVDTYLLAFFDTYLKGQPSPLLAGPSPDFPEVHFESRLP